MNILILGGIFLLAFIAIVAAVLLVMGERGAESNAKESAMMTAPAIPVAASSAGEEGGRAAATIPLSAQPSDTATDAGAPDTSSLSPAVTRTFPSLDEESFSLIERQEVQDGINGQFRELSAELRALHARAQEMEQRISMLTEIVDRIESEQGNLLDIGIDSES